MWREVRCQGLFKGRGPGVCNQLLLRVDPLFPTAGRWETRCPRCKTIRTIRIDHPALVST